MNGEIDWNKIETAHGQASHIPRAMIKLLSPKESIREEGYWEIDNYVVLQSDLCPAAYYVIEPVLEIIENPACIDQLKPLEILTEIALGTAPDHIMVTDELGKEIPVYEACREKLRDLEPRILKIVARNKQEQDDIDIILEKIGEWKNGIIQ